MPLVFVTIYRKGPNFEPVYGRFTRALPRLVSETFTVLQTEVVVDERHLEPVGIMPYRMAITIAVPFTPERRYLHDKWYTEKLRKKVRHFYPPGSPKGGLPIQLHFPHCEEV
jgi:hypothetical protein